MSLRTAKRPKIKLMDRSMLPVQPVNDHQRKPDAWFRSERHLAHVRTLACACGCGVVPGNELNPIEAAHVRTATDGCAGEKPSDVFVLPLAARCHRIQHSMSEAAFWRDRGVVDPAGLALTMATHSPCSRTRKAATAVIEGRDWRTAE